MRRVNLIYFAVPAANQYKVGRCEVTLDSDDCAHDQLTPGVTVTVPSSKKTQPHVAQSH